MSRLPQLASAGITVSLPPGWEGRIALRPTPLADFHTPAAAGAVRTASGAEGTDGRLGWRGEITRPVVHLATFALPPDRGDFGSGAVGLMRDEDVFLSLFEFGPESVDTALFATKGVPRPRPREFEPNALQRRLPGQLGYQRFFTEAGRPFTLFAVLGSARDPAGACTKIQSVLRATSIAPAPHRRLDAGASR